jgi:hypothetical protein
VKQFLAIFITIFAFLSCDNSMGEMPDRIIYNKLIECPAEIADKALYYANKYVYTDTEYEYGGQDLLRAIRIDCSGLIVNCYKYAIAETGFVLPFNDAAVIDFFKTWTVKTAEPRPGDVIFMGDTDIPTHISIFSKIENECIYFVDATYKLEDNIDGVSERNYHMADNRFLSFGRLLIGSIL